MIYVKVIRNLTGQENGISIPTKRKSFPFLTYIDLPKINLLLVSLPHLFVFFGQP